MQQRVFKLLLLLVPPIVAMIITYGMLRSYFLMPKTVGDSAVVTIEIAQGKGLSQIATELKDKGLIKSVFVLKVLARLGNGGSTIQAGEYEMSAGMTPREILQKLISGDIKKRRVLVKEGATLWDIGAALADAGVITKDESDII